MKKAAVTALLFLFLLWCSGGLRSNLDDRGTVKNYEENLHHPIFHYDYWVKTEPDILFEPCLFHLKNEEDSAKLSYFVDNGIFVTFKSSSGETTIYSSQTLEAVIRFVDGELLAYFQPNGEHYHAMITHGMTVT